MEVSVRKPRLQPACQLKTACLEGDVPEHNVADECGRKRQERPYWQALALIHAHGRKRVHAQEGGESVDQRQRIWMVEVVDRKHALVGKHNAANKGAH